MPMVSFHWHLHLCNVCIDISVVDLPTDDFPAEIGTKERRQFLIPEAPIESSAAISIQIRPVNTPFTLSHNGKSNQTYLPQLLSTNSQE
jgi:hypothetical protein